MTVRRAGSCSSTSRSIRSHSKLVASLGWLEQQRSQRTPMSASATLRNIPASLSSRWVAVLVLVVQQGPSA